MRQSDEIRPAHAIMAGQLLKCSEVLNNWNIRRAAVMLPVAGDAFATLVWSGGPAPGSVVLDGRCSVEIQGDRLLVRRLGKTVLFRAAPGGPCLETWGSCLRNVLSSNTPSRSVATSDYDTEKAALRRPDAALSIHELTKAQRTRLQDLMAHDERACTIGVTNTIASAVIATRFPEHYWLWHVAKAFVYIPWRYVRFRRIRAQLYLLDWCYVITWLINIGALVALFNPAPVSRSFIIAGFAMASGPLAWSVFVFRNSLVFHDVDNMTSVFIHLSPLLLFWTLRWGAGFGPSVVAHAWPGVFDVCPDLPAADACLTSWEGVLWCSACTAALPQFVLSPTAFYLCWAVPYLVIVLWWLGPWTQRTGHEVLYDYFAKVQPRLVASFQKWLGPCVGHALAPRLGYMLLHFVSVISFGATSFLLWHSFVLHTAFSVCIVVCAAHNGSTYSFRVFAFRYAQAQLAAHPEIVGDG